MHTPHTNNKPPQRVCLGKIATAHGVRGLVKLLVYADDPALLNGNLYTAETGQDTLSITMKNSMGKYWLGAVDGVADRTGAEALRGTTLWYERDALPDMTEEDEFYVTDLVGMAVINKDGTEIGIIHAVDNYGAGDLLEIIPMGGKSFLLPFTKEYVPEIDLSGKRITVENIEPFLG